MDRTAPPNPNELNEIISPEGVEERVELEETFRMTMTQGGKFRVYHIREGQTNSVGIYDTREAARKFLGEGMMVFGAMLADPKKTIQLIIDELGGRRNDV